VKAWEFELEEIAGQRQLSVGDAGLLAAYFLPPDSKRFACMDIVLLHCIARKNRYSLVKNVLSSFGRLGRSQRDKRVSENVHVTTQKMPA
jgi:hypothetical protein